MPAHALEGITVLEFATVIAAPLGAALLADLGARVIKVEPIGGEPFRGNTAGLPGHVGVAKTTAGKEGICLDLKQDAGREVVAKLIRNADVLIPQLPARCPRAARDRLRARERPQPRHRARPSTVTGRRARAPRGPRRIPSPAPSSAARCNRPARRCPPRPARTSTNCVKRRAGCSAPTRQTLIRIPRWSWRPRRCLGCMRGVARAAGSRSS